MPKPKKQHLKKRKDGRYKCSYAGVQFYGMTEEEALQKREDYKKEVVAEGYIRENPTVTQYAERWLNTAKAGLSMHTYNCKAIHIEHLCNCIGNLYLRSVRPSDIKKVYSEYYLSASDDYIKHARSLFIRIFQAAVDDGIIRTNPASSASAKPHKGTTGSHRSITPDERRIIETVATDHPMHTAAIIMLYAGLRPQEVKALRMEDIDKHYIHVRNFVHVSGTNSYSVSEKGKTKKAARLVPLFPPVAEAIKGKKGLILSNAGEVASPTAWRRSWESYRNQIERHLNGMQKRWYGRTKEHKAILAEKKSLPPWKSFDVTPYDLRHSFATWCRDQTPPVEMHTVVNWMGHKDATMILRIYDEVSAERDRTEADRIKKDVFKVQLEVQNKS